MMIMYLASDIGKHGKGFVFQSPDTGKNNTYVYHKA